MSVYCSSDWHGCGWVWQKVKSILKPEDKLYFLGDAIDRGPDSFKIMKELYEDPRVVYLKGNHEDMMVAATLKQSNHYKSPFEVWMYNGGMETVNSIKSAEPYNLLRIWAKKINELPTQTIYINQMGDIIYMTHSGWLNSEPSNHTVYDRLWDRSHFYEEPEEDIIILHGHTPIPYLWSRLGSCGNRPEPGAFFYRGGRKIDVDCGTPYTGIATLLDLDTYEETVLLKADTKEWEDAFRF